MRVVPEDRTRFGPADRVTFARAVLTCAVAGLAGAAAVDGLEAPASQAGGVGLLVGLAAVALVLDAVDGWVARHTRTVSAFGARFDLEVDAFLIAVLSLHVAREVGWWVAAIGAVRYVLLMAQQLLPWLRIELPPSRWRKVVAAYQGIALTAVAAHALPSGVAAAVLATGLVALAISFGTEVRSLWRLRPPPVMEPVPACIGSVLE
ncbi:MAG TPA: CDP-alcohol phosphatidyltransferase family protein [Intrasporangium sp.]|nr:CDP-alcohol phosphatidyltransferase family protein [Intrasporangium sp.]